MQFKGVLVIVAAMLLGAAAYWVSVSGRAEESAAPYLTEMPSGYRDWQFVSVAHEAGNLHSFSAVLANDIAIKAYRDGTLPFPDGAIIVGLHYTYVPSAENNRIFGREQSFVPGAPTNVQFDVKDSKKYAATGGWGFGFFTDGKPNENAAVMKTCSACHAKASRDFVFTRYAP